MEQRPIRVCKRRSVYSWYSPDGKTRYQDYIYGKWSAWCRRCGWGERFIYADHERAITAGLQHLQRCRANEQPVS